MALVGFNVGNVGANANLQTLDVDEVPFLLGNDEEDTYHYWHGTTLA